ncbi:nitrogenase component 1 [uncultured Dialister sp.]|uniref:nitrogenase component 1 n=1 Tax=uncultured Dialister sp. TaxID=278064 RepID=UPI0025CE3187|nr:nitrogenase component 1 [uncultured Dialister sp.]
MWKPEWEAACNHTATCGLTGSAAFFSSIPGSFVMVNGPLWCYFYAMKYVDDLDETARNRFYCTQPGQESLVYGTEKDLVKGFEMIKQMGKFERVFIQSNCSISLVGDDVAGIASSQDLPWPVYAADSGGLKGDFAKGYQQAFLRVMDEMKPLSTVKHTVNVLGLSLSDLKGKENALEIKRLLTMSGLTVNAIPGAGSTWEEIMNMPSAELNIVVRPELSEKAARRMETDFHVPYIETGLPCGTEVTMKWLEKIKESLPSMNLSAAAKEAADLKRHLTHLGGGMQSLWGQLWFDEILVSAWPSDAAAIAETVRGEWADTGKLLVHLQEPSEIKIPAADIIRTVRADDAAINEDYKNWQGGLLLASSHETTRLGRLGKKARFIPIFRPVYEEMLADSTPLYGLAGAARLFERVFNAGIAEKRKD